MRELKILLWVTTLTTTGIASAQIVPSDGQDPKQAGGAKLLESVCAGRVVSGDTIQCRVACPDFTGLPTLQSSWTLTRVTRGHFRSATSDDAALWMEGCEPHSQNWGGTILLTLVSNRWKMIWHKPGLDTNECHKLTLGTGRETLVCIGYHWMQAFRWASLYVEDLLNPTDAMMAGTGEFFKVFNDTLSCGGPDKDGKPRPLTHGSIEKVTFAAGDKNGAETLSVIATFGRRQLTSGDLDPCFEASKKGFSDSFARFFGPVRSYQIDFLFDGHNFKVAPGSAEAARIFQSQ